MSEIKIKPENPALSQRILTNGPLAQRLRRGLNARLCGSPKALDIVQQLSDEQIIRRYLETGSPKHAFLGA